MQTFLKNTCLIPTTDRKYSLPKIGRTTIFSNSATIFSSLASISEINANIYSNSKRKEFLTFSATTLSLGSDTNTLIIIIVWRTKLRTRRPSVMNKQLNHFPHCHVCKCNSREAFVHMCSTFLATIIAHQNNL